jgi:hypothetical protein
VVVKIFLVILKLSPAYKKGLESSKTSSEVAWEEMFLECWAFI